MCKLSRHFVGDVFAPCAGEGLGKEPSSGNRLTGFKGPTTVRMTPQVERQLSRITVSQAQSEHSASDFGKVPTGDTNARLSRAL